MEEDLFILTRQLWSIYNLPIFKTLCKRRCLEKVKQNTYNVHSIIVFSLPGQTFWQTTHFYLKRAMIKISFSTRIG